MSDSEYLPDSPRRSENYYGQTKIMAEDIVKELPGSLIVRIPVLYGYNDGSDKPTFPTRVLDALSKGEKLVLDNRQIRFPVLTDDVAEAVKSLLHKSGIVQLTSKIPNKVFVGRDYPQFAFRWNILGKPLRNKTRRRLTPRWHIQPGI
jgi:dTDP-4-dehydrorhamnose reductase